MERRDDRRGGLGRERAARIPTYPIQPPRQHKPWARARDSGVK
nr:hypothetical protein [Sciscionella marina]